MRKSKISENTLARWSDIIMGGFEIKPSTPEEREQRLRSELKRRISEHRQQAINLLTSFKNEGFINNKTTLEQIIEILSKEVI
jgi:hypothetical protein